MISVGVQVRESPTNFCGDFRCPYNYGTTEQDVQLHAFGHWLEGDGRAWLPLAFDVLRDAQARARMWNSMV